MSIPAEQEHVITLQGEKDSGWTDTVYNDQLKEGDMFKPFQVYKLTVYLEAEGGYRFAKDADAIRKDFAQDPAKRIYHTRCMTVEEGKKFKFVIQFVTTDREKKPQEPAEPKPQPQEPEQQDPKPQPQPKAHWEQLNDGRWVYLKADGSRLKSAWKGDYYLKADGIMADNEWIYDKQYHGWYYLKADGRYARNEWRGECYLGKYDKMVTSDWVYDTHYQAWYYLMKDGRYARNTVIDGKHKVGIDGKYIR